MMKLASAPRPRGQVGELASTTLFLSCGGGCPFTKLCVLPHTPGDSSIHPPALLPDVRTPIPLLLQQFPVALHDDHIGEP